MNAKTKLGITLIVIMTLFALFAGFIAPYGANQYSAYHFTNRMSPVGIHIINPTTHKLTRPFIYRYKRILDLKQFDLTYRPILNKRYPIQFFVRGTPYNLLGLFHTDIHLFGVSSPAKLYLLGTDSYGRDLLSRIIIGSRITLLASLIATFIAVFIGCFLGAVAGFYGGAIDNITMRFTELINAIPMLFIILSLRAVIPLETPPLEVLIWIVIVLGLIGWGSLARMIRGQFLTLKEMDYIHAAHGLGYSNKRIIFNHIMPNVKDYILSYTVLTIPMAMLAIAAVNFLGLGITDPYVSWGILLNNAQQAGFAGISDAPWILIPGIFIVM